MSSTRSKVPKVQTFYASCTACKTLLPAGSVFPHCSACMSLEAIPEPEPTASALAAVGPAVPEESAMPPPWTVAFTRSFTDSFAQSMTSLTRVMQETLQTGHRGRAAESPSSRCRHSSESSPTRDIDSGDNSGTSYPVLGPRPPKRPRRDTSPVSSRLADPHVGGSQFDGDEEQQNSTSPQDETSEEDSLVDDLVSSINTVLDLTAPPPPVETSQSEELYQFLPPSKPRGSFFDHSNFRSTVQTPRACLDKRFAKKQKDTRYPFPQEVVKSWSASPKVDPPVSRLSANTVMSVADGSSLKDATDCQSDLLQRSIYEATGASFAPAFAAVWAMQAVSSCLAEINVVAQDIPEVATLTSQATAFSDYARTAVMESASRTTVASANSLAARRMLWLRDWKADAISKKFLQGLPFSGNRLFGEQLDDLIKESTGGKTTSMPQSRKQKPGQRQMQAKFRAFRPSSKPSFSSSSRADKDQKQTRAWRTKAHQKKPAGAPASKAAST